MGRIDPWTWLDLWLDTWEEEWEPDVFAVFQIKLMQELEDILEINPYNSQTDESSESSSEDEEDRFYPEICPEDLDPSNGRNWETSEKGDVQKTL